MLDLENMDNDDAELLYRCIEVIESQETILALKIADWPMMKEAPRNKFYNTLNKLANPSTLKSDAKAITMADLAAILK